MMQKTKFFESEDDGWYERNRIEKPADIAQQIKSDPVLAALVRQDMSFSDVLEIGASDGWRLAALKDHYPEARLTGIDPSAKAVESASSGVTLKQAAADALPFADDSFDLVIFGFCLYLCDRRDLFRIAAEADRVLKDGGFVITYDFDAPAPYRNRYAHVEGLFSYKMDYSQMFSWNPAYRLIHHAVMPHPGAQVLGPDNGGGVGILQKNVAQGWPDNPYKS